jgi:hypothetical protein
MITQYRIENNDEIKLWFIADRIEYDEEDELVKGFLNGVQSVEYVMNVNDVVYTALDYKKVYWRTI